MYWIYILKSDDGKYYIGQTKRLFRRLFEVLNCNTCDNTNAYQIDEIVAIYKSNILNDFLIYNKNVIDTKNQNIFYNFELLDNFGDNTDIENNYDNFILQNFIVESFKHKSSYPDNIIGGKYIKDYVKYKNSYFEEKYLINLPLCHCGIPCDIKKNQDKNYLFFRCAKKNMWNDFINKFNIEDEPCSFFKEYTEDIEFRKNYKTKNINDFIPKANIIYNKKYNNTTKCSGYGECFIQTESQYIYGKDISCPHDCKLSYCKICGIPEPQLILNSHKGMCMNCARIVQ